MKKLKRLGVLVSGNGTTLQAIIDSCINRELNAAVSIVISNKPGAFALERAKNHNIPGFVVERSNFDSQSSFTKEITKLFKEHQVDYIIFAGFLQILTEEIVKEFPERLINIHPSLIPKHCGKGYWGLKVHQSVIDSGEEISGATVHFVDEGCDTGKIILQRQIKVDKHDTAESLQKKVQIVERSILIDALKTLINKENS